MANTTFDPSMLNATVTVNADADTYAEQAPPEEGEYLVLLKGPKKTEDFYQPRMQKDAAGADTDKLSHVSFRVHGEIVDPGGKADGLAVFPHVFATPTTKFSERAGTTSVLSLVKRLGFDHLVHSGDISHAEQINIFQQALAARPQIRVKVQWRLPGQKLPNGSYEQDRIVGMMNFPKDSDGNYVWQVPADPLKPQGDKISARAEIVEWIGSPTA